MRKGHTILELFVVIAFIAIVAAVAMMSYAGRRGTAEFNSTAKQIVALLRQGQSQAMSQTKATNWSVYFHNATNTTPYFALVSSSSYVSSSVVERKTLPKSVVFATSSLPLGGTKTVTFTQITGRTASTTIRIISLSSAALSSTISVASSGAVQF